MLVQSRNQEGSVCLRVLHRQPEIVLFAVETSPLGINFPNQIVATSDVSGSYLSPLRGNDEQNHLTCRVMISQRPNKIQKIKHVERSRVCRFSGSHSSVNS